MNRKKEEQKKKCRRKLKKREKKLRKGEWKRRKNAETKEYKERQNKKRKKTGNFSYRLFLDLVSANLKPPKSSLAIMAASADVVLWMGRPEGGGGRCEACWSSSPSRSGKLAERPRRSSSCKHYTKQSV